MRWRASSITLLVVASLVLAAGCKSRPQRKLLTDRPGERSAAGLTWKCGLLGGGLGAAAGFGLSMGGTALTTEKWPLNEPVVRYGPFVMNTQEEILQAISDYQFGNF